MCQRLRWPTVSLVCDGLDCGAQIEGFYFRESSLISAVFLSHTDEVSSHSSPDCCCDGKELDFCRHCVLQREEGCPDDHVREWGVRPIPTPGFSTESMERQLVADLPQKVVTGDLFHPWMRPVDSPPRLSTAVRRYGRILAERQKVQDGLEKGEITVKIERELIYLPTPFVAPALLIPES